MRSLPLIDGANSYSYFDIWHDSMYKKWWPHQHKRIINHVRTWPMLHSDRPHHNWALMSSLESLIVRTRASGLLSLFPRGFGYQQRSHFYEAPIKLSSAGLKPFHKSLPSLMRLKRKRALLIFFNISTCEPTVATMVFSKYAFVPIKFPERKPRSG